MIFFFLSILGISIPVTSVYLDICKIFVISSCSALFDQYSYFDIFSTWKSRKLKIIMHKDSLWNTLIYRCNWGANTKVWFYTYTTIMNSCRFDIARPNIVYSSRYISCVLFGLGIILNNWAEPNLLQGRDGKPRVFMIAGLPHLCGSSAFFLGYIHRLNKVR